MSNSLTWQMRKLRLRITQAVCRPWNTTLVKLQIQGSFWLNNYQRQCPSNQGWAFLLPRFQGTFFFFFNPSPWSGKYINKTSHEEQCFGFTLTLSNILLPKHHFLTAKAIHLRSHTPHHTLLYSYLPGQFLNYCQRRLYKKKLACCLPRPEDFYSANVVVKIPTMCKD